MDEISEAEKLLQAGHEGPERVEALRRLATALVANFEETGSASNWSVQFQHLDR